MTAGQSDLADRAAELRLAFDQGFAEPPAAAARADTDFLAFRVAAKPYAIALSDITGLFADKKVTPLPGGMTAQLGVAGFRSAVMPVYDLALLLGHPGTGAQRWLMVAAGTPVALAFDTFDGHLRVPRSAIVAQDASKAGAEPSRRHVREFVVTQDLIRPIVHLASIIDSIRGGMPPTGPR